MAAPKPAVATSSRTELDFEAFHEEWLVDQQRLLHRLIRLSTQNDAVSTEEESLIEEVLSHYKRYYDEKAKAIADLPFYLFPPWMRLTDLEEELFWIGGFRPSMALRVMETAVVDLTPEQKERLAVMKEEVEEEESTVEKEEEVMEVVRIADDVRRKTVVKVVESLSTKQAVKFLVDVGSYHLGLRCMGINFPL